MRRTWIVDKKFQWTIVAYSFALSLLTSLAEYTIARLKLIEQVRQSAAIDLLWFSPNKIIVFCYVLLYACIFVISVLVSNRLAGPLYRLRRYMERAARGEPAETIHFRDRDYHAELAETYNRMIRRLPPGKDQKGFSLIELMVVVGVMSIFMAIAAATFTGLPQDRLSFRQEVMSLHDLLLTARNAALVKNQCAFVTVTDAQTVTLQTFAIPSPCTTAPLPPPDMNVVRTFKPTTTVTPFDIGPTLVFRPSGGTTALAPATVTINSGLTTGLSNRLVIYPAIGQVRLL